MSRAVAAAALLAALAVARPAAADPQAEAVVLFDQGIKDLKAGRIEKACSELAASLALVKDSGTKGALARCHGRAGRVASAWLLWRELADTAPSAELRTDAAAQATRLERRLPRYAIKLAGTTPGLDVQVNGRDVALDVPVPVPIDPGPVAVTAIGRDGERATTRPWTRDYTAVEGEVLEIEIPTLEPLVVVAPRPVPRVIDPPPDRRSEITASRHRRGIAAIVLGAVALGAAGGGTAFGLQARSRYNDAKQICGGAIDPCEPVRVALAKDRVDASRRSALYSDLAFGAAGAAALAAVIVWVTAPSLESAPVSLAPSLGDRSAGVALAGRF